MITASSLRRIRRCAISTTLPRAEVHNPWAKVGQDDHEELADVDDVEHDFAHLIPPGARSEVKLGYDCATGVGRIIGEGGGRDYGMPGPMEIVGSCDVLGVVDGVAVVIDWKTGHAEVAPASENEQLWMYALAAARALNLDAARVVIVYTKMGRIDSHDLDLADLAEFATMLAWLHPEVTRRQAASQRGETLDAREGDWCKHCQSKSRCPAKVGLIAQFASQGLAVIGDTVMTTDRAAEAYRQVSRFEQLVEDAKKRLAQYVTENGPIDLGDGRMYGRYERKGKRQIDASKAVQAMRDVVGEKSKEFESIAVEQKVTFAAMERAAKALSLPKIDKAITKRIEQLGGIRVGNEYPIGEFNTAKNKPAELPEPEYDALNAALKAV